MDPSDHTDPRLVPLALTAFATGLYLALLVATFGLVSLISDTDVIDVDGASLLLGPAMSASAVIIVAVRLAGVAVRHVHDLEHGFSTMRVPLAAGAITAICAALAYAVIGGMLRAAATGQVVEVFLFAGHELLRPYALAAGVIAFLVHFLFALVLATGGERRRRPLWPWEK